MAILEGTSPTLYVKRAIPVEAYQWWKNGDHPDDYTKDHENPSGTKWTASERRLAKAEGDIVRYFRNPEFPGAQVHSQAPGSARPYCYYAMSFHGWIETMEGGHIVCPGDWIITGIRGERYPCEDSIFRESYMPYTPTEGEVQDK